MVQSKRVKKTTSKTHLKELFQRNVARTKKKIMKKEQLLVKHTLLMAKYKPMHYTFTFPDLMENFLA